jgi:hypothetical protein
LDGTLKKQTVSVSLKGGDIRYANRIGKKEGHNLEDNPKYLLAPDRGRGLK